MNTESQDEKINKKEPDEEAGFYVEAHVKIFDPLTEEVFIFKRS